MTELTTRCDHCKIAREESNHWHQAHIIISHGFYDKGSLVLGSYGADHVRKIDLCSERCVIEYVSQFIAKPAPAVSEASEPGSEADLF